ncbi:ADP-ribosylglycohydrolase family protein [Saccharopolyspora sp. ASAGF58]|uniref:ADP-ribosylglycohydrolase family protein n=1 Tax=Saccharopolyspora sp. ASAGF58 TaxID=2719023 RepID=UPI001FF09BB9|nr:ADP-ribosylglycohydrolase family protein [Saccharopolyspora sp. ASAGF58]
MVLNVLESERGNVPRGFYKKGIQSRVEGRDVFPDDGPVFMQALLERRQMSYYSFVDESPGRTATAEGSTSSVPGDLSETPLITPEMREAARRRAGGYLYITDSGFDASGDVSKRATKGAFKVGKEGEIGEYYPNPNYRPSPVERAGPPANWIDRGMRRAMSGRIGQYNFLQLIAKAVLPVLVTPEGHLMLLKAPDGPRLVAYTASGLVPEDVYAKPMYLPRLLKALPADAILAVNGSAELQAQFPVADLVAALRDNGLLVDNSTGGLDVGPAFWVQQSARLAELVDEPTFTAIEQVVAQWGKLSETTPERGRAIELGITAVEVLVKGGITDPDVLAAAAVFNAADPLYNGSDRISMIIAAEAEGTRVLALVRSALSPQVPSDADPDRAELVNGLVYHLYVEHLRAMPLQTRAIVLANRIAEAITPWVMADLREHRQYDLRRPLRSCARDFPDALRAQVAEQIGIDPRKPSPWKLDPEPRASITSPAQAIECARTAIGELADPVHAEDIGLAYLVRSETDPEHVHFVHKVWETVTSEVDSEFAIDEYRAKYDVFPFEPEREHVGQVPRAQQSQSTSGHPAPKPIDAHERFIGSMLGGAMGDALGYAIEFNDIGMIRRNHGDSGLTAPVLRDGVAQISDDTQMMLFTLEGLIRAHVARRINPTDNDPVPEVQHAYQRWFHTQNQPWAQAGGPYARHLQQPDGWLITNPELFSPRAPGSTCMSALAKFAQTHQHANPQFKINDSKGCGGVMRAAPVAVWSNDPAEVFYAAVGTAALTHSHPSGYLSAGVLAVIVHQLIRAVPLPESVRMARDLLLRWRGHEEQLQFLDAAVELAKKGAVTPEEIKDTLGQGWVGEEALAIGLYAVLATDNLRDALLLSVNHSGDSDSTGIVCGNIAGALYGARAVPQEWLASLELRELVETLAKDALVEFSPGPPTDPGWTRRYPAW